MPVIINAIEMTASRSPFVRPGAGAAFLLAQVGAHASAGFAQRLAPLGLTPPQAGILRAVQQAHGLSQRALGDALGMFPSRLVLVIDELEQRALIERRASEHDRRSYELHLSAAGEQLLERVGRVAREHQEALCAALSEAERAQLTQLLTRIAQQQALVPGVHPGYRKLGGAPLAKDAAAPAAPPPSAAGRAASEKAKRASKSRSRERSGGRGRRPVG